MSLRRITQVRYQHNIHDITKPQYFRKRQDITKVADNKDSEQSGGASVLQDIGNIYSTGNMTQDIKEQPKIKEPYIKAKPMMATAVIRSKSDPPRHERQRGLRSDNLLPGDKLKLKLLKNMKKDSVFTYPVGGGKGGAKGDLEPAGMEMVRVAVHKEYEPKWTTKGDGLNLAGDGLGLAGIGLRLAGRGIPFSGEHKVVAKKMTGAIADVLYPKIIHELKKARIIKRDMSGGSIAEKLTKLVSSKVKKILPATKSKISNVVSHIPQVAKDIAPNLVKLAVALSGSQMGSGSIEKLNNLLSKHLTMGMKKMVVKKQSGGAFKLLGKDKKWWKDFGKGFAKGFKMVGKPASKIIAGIAPLVGQPELAPIFSAIGNAL